MNFLTLFLEGGPMMIPLALCSIWALYIVIWKTLTLWKLPMSKALFWEKLQNQLLNYGKDRVLTDLSDQNDVSSMLAKSILSASDYSEQEAKEQLHATLNQISVRLEKGLHILQGLISIAPMIGLLGTVLGLMTIFKGLSAAMSGDVSGMYAGISVALINTVSGLAIAIPAAFFYQHFSNKLTILMADIEAQSVAFLNFCRNQLK